MGVSEVLGAFLQRKQKQEQRRKRAWKRMRIFSPSPPSSAVFFPLASLSSKRRSIELQVRCLCFVSWRARKAATSFFVLFYFILFLFLNIFVDPGTPLSVFHGRSTWRVTETKEEANYGKNKNMSYLFVYLMCELRSE